MHPDPPSELATEADIHACYRLFFGRPPDRDGLNHWRNWISGGLPLSDLVDAFVASSEFRTRVIFQRIAGHYTKPLPERVDAGGYWQYVHADDPFINPEIVRHQRYEPHVTAVFRRVVKPGMVVLDLGASVGYFSLLAAHLVGPAGRVIAFEPGADNAKLLMMSALANRFEHVDLYPNAVADRESIFFFDVLLGSNGALGTEVGGGMNPEEITGLYYRTLVRTIRLDAILSPLPRLDVVKMDVEGAEYRALIGGQRLIDRHRPIMFLEFSPAGLRNVSQVSGETLLALLVAKHYTLSVIEADGRVIACQQDIARVMRMFEASQLEHLDLIAYPIPLSPSVRLKRWVMHRFLRFIRAIEYKVCATGS